MAKAPSSNKTPDLGLVDLFKEEEALRKQLEDVRQRRMEASRRQADEIRATVVQRLADIAKMIAPFIDDENWSWRATGEFDGVLAELELQPKEAKPIVLTDEFKELVVAFVKSKTHGCGIDDIAAGVLDAGGKPAYKVSSLRQRLPLLVNEKALKVRKDGTSNVYFVE